MKLVYVNIQKTLSGKEEKILRDNYSVIFQIIEFLLIFNGGCSMSDQSLYEKIGREAAINKVVDYFTMSS
ncbi:hypothetical protein J2S17_000096 [Cytobacillus purgationiresistens]|uniref:Uncharacterized protein n=1 Tax=Cytobacillus purgationiresistens TaxID=863449 RepID=A0ABU0AAE8_9BACI|nr:hypothetical protein [Cytobacillus purgationiresistens]